MAQKKAGTGIKNKALYKRLRNLGVSAKRETAHGKRRAMPSR
jgi:hypothetical protein